MAMALLLLVKWCHSTSSVVNARWGCTYALVVKWFDYHILFHLNMDMMGKLWAVIRIRICTLENENNFKRTTSFISRVKETATKND